MIHLCQFIRPQGQGPGAGETAYNIYLWNGTEREFCFSSRKITKINFKVHSGGRALVRMVNVSNPEQSSLFQKGVAFHSVIQARASGRW
jgi:hypothetical protein